MSDGYDRVRCQMISVSEDFFSHFLEMRRKSSRTKSNLEKIRENQNRFRSWTIGKTHTLRKLWDTCSCDNLIEPEQTQLIAQFFILKKIFTNFRNFQSKMDDYRGLYVAIKSSQIFLCEKSVFSAVWVVLLLCFNLRKEKEKKSFREENITPLVKNREKLFSSRAIQR